MQSATVVLAQRALEEGKLKRFQAQVTYHYTPHFDFYQKNWNLYYLVIMLITNMFQEIFEEALDQLREAISILQVEPDGKEQLQDQMENLSRLLTSDDDEE